MAGIAVLCWEENRPWISALRQKGFSVPWVEEPKVETYKQIPAVEPQLLVVDMTRTPERGRVIILDLAERGDLDGIPVLLVSDKAAVDRGLRSKVKNLSVTRPSKLISAVRALL